MGACLPACCCSLIRYAKEASVDGKKFLSREPNEALLCCAININYDFSDGLNSLSRLFKQDFRQLHFSVCFSFPSFQHETQTTERNSRLIRF